MTKAQKTRLKNIGIGMAAALFGAVVVVPVVYVAANSMYTWAFGEEVVEVKQPIAKIKAIPPEIATRSTVRSTSLQQDMDKYVRVRRCLESRGFVEGKDFRQKEGSRGSTGTVQVRSVKLQQSPKWIAARKACKGA